MKVVEQAGYLRFKCMFKTYMDDKQLLDIRCHLDTNDPALFDATVKNVANFKNQCLLF